MMFQHIAVCLLIVAEVAVGLRFSIPNTEDLDFTCDKKSCPTPTQTTAHYDYKPDECTGPHNWHNLAECWYRCDSSKYNLQSPVNIDSNKAVFKAYSDFQYQESLCKRVDGFIENHGDAPHFDTGTTSPTAINIKNVPGKTPDDRFTFNEMHIHLGRDDAKGSEHSVDNQFYPMEVHMVFWNRDKYDNALEAKQSKDGLLAIGVFVKSDAEDNEEVEEVEQKSSKTGNLDMDCVCEDSDSDCIKSGKCSCKTDGDCAGANICRDQSYCSEPRKCDVRYAERFSELMEKYYPIVKDFPSSKEDIEEGISPSDALPYTWDFYTYEGSLTTPPCFQTVRWVVMRCPIMISEKAFQVFKAIKDRDGNSLQTYGVRRPIQRGLDEQHPVQIERNFQWNDQSPRIPSCNDEF